MTDPQATCGYVSMQASCPQCGEDHVWVVDPLAKPRVCPDKHQSAPAAKARELYQKANFLNGYNEGYGGPSVDTSKRNFEEFCAMFVAALEAEYQRGVKDGRKS